MNERERIAEELRRVRDEVRERALHEGPVALPPPLATRTPTPMPTDPVPGTLVAPRRPDNSALNVLQSLAPGVEGGFFRRTLVRGLGRILLGRLVGVQERFNGLQVQFDNELLEYLEARLALTHGHYDSVLGIHSRHMAEIDERHLIVQEELVSHVHDLVKRIDLVLGQSERGRLSLEAALQDVRQRLLKLEERLGRE